MRHHYSASGVPNFRFAAASASGVNGRPRRTQGHRPGENIRGLHGHQGRSHHRLRCAAERDHPGTTVTLHLKPEEPDAEHGRDYTAEHVIKEIVKRYSDFVTYPIRMQRCIG